MYYYEITTFLIITVNPRINGDEIMQAVLPDLNTALIRFRAMVTSHLERRDYTGCFGSLYAMNGILDPEWRVQVSTEEYNRLTKQDIFVKCKGCTKDINYNLIKIHNLLLQPITSFISGHNYEKVWICPKCKIDNKLSCTEMKQTEIQPGGFLHVVPEPPRREEGVMDRTEYHNRVSQWVWTFVKEIEERCGEERKAYLNREDSMLDIPEDEEK